MSGYVRFLPVVAALILATPGASFAQPAARAITGVVMDSAGAPIAGVRVSLVDLGRRASTTAEGRFRFSALVPGSYTVSFSLLGFAPETRRVAVGESDARLEVRLRASRMELAAVQVTATAIATGAQASPQATAVLAGPELRVSQGAALGELLENIPGVRSLGMTTGIGKPVIRGMTHYRVVTLDNGQRTETQAWGHDHSPNVETAAAERVEVIKGPSSVLYGSDALGGVINVIAPPVPDALDVAAFARGRISGSWNHNIRGADGTVSGEGAVGGWGLRGALTQRSSGDMRTPEGTLDNTNNRATATELAGGYRTGAATFTLRYTGRDERIEILDDPVRNPDYTGFQRIATRRAAAELLLPVRGSRLQVSGGWERNFRREFADAAATTADLGLFVQNLTAFAHLHHAPLGPLTGTLGISGMTSDFENRGSVTLIPDSRTRSAAAYLFEQVERGRWTATFGARADARSLGTSGNDRTGTIAQSRTFNAVTGSAGVLYRMAGPVSLVFNVARGFRAPAAPDLFANGFHEGTRAFERGDPTLAVETSINTELGMRVSRHDLQAELTGFVNRVDDYIYLRPFGTGAGVFDSLQVVQGDARLAGVEGRAAWRPLPLLTMQLSGDYVRGDNLSANVPLTFVPPLRVQYGMRLEDPTARGSLHRPHVAVSAETNARQRRLDPRDVGPPGYTIASAAAGFGWLVPRGVLSVDLSARNLFDVRYRSFMSRYKEFALGAGRTFILRVTTPL